MATPTYDQAKIEHFKKLHKSALEYAESVGLSLTVIEGECRDVLAQVEAHRLLFALRQRGAKL